MIKLNLEKTKRYVIGVSGGPDSMALLDMCRSQDYDVIAVHMNYAKRDTADRDEQIIRAYCENYGIPYAFRMQNKRCKGNFQAFARAERYALYKEIREKENADAVLLAHHLDDHLETYLMQQKRQSMAQYYGIQKQVMLYDCQVIRPLLAFTKQELLAYCHEHKVPYGIDESNLTNDYTRNQIRHKVIEQMSRIEKDAMNETIQRVNITWEIQQREGKAFLDVWAFDLYSLRLLDAKKRCLVLFIWIWEELHYAISQILQQQLSELVLQETSWSRPLINGAVLFASYGKLELVKNDEEFCYVYDHIENVKTPYFSLVKEGNTIEGVTIRDEDFPITIRNVQKGDAIHLRIGTKKVHRWFIDRKITQKERKTWPVLVNAVGNVIFVPGIGCDIEHFSNNPNVFVLK